MKTIKIKQEKINEVFYGENAIEVDLSRFNPAFVAHGVSTTAGVLVYIPAVSEKTLKKARKVGLNG